MCKEVLEHVYEVNKAKEWQSVPAKVKTIKSTSKSSGDGETKIIRTQFNYYYQGHNHFSTKAGLVNEGGFGFTFDEWETEILSKLERGEAIEAWANPDKPSQAVLFRGFVWDHIFFMGIFLVVFGGVGLGGILFLIWAWKEEKLENKLKQRYPSEPWKWRRDWEHGRLKCSSKGKMIAMWAFAIFWNGISSFVPFVAWQGFKAGEYWVLVALLFPIIGMILLWMAVKRTINFSKNGTSSLILNTHPGVTGGQFSATFISPSPVHLKNSIVATLECTRTESSGDDTYERTLWETKRDMSKDSVGNLNFSGATFNFTIPYDCAETNEEQKISWKLYIKAEAEGPDIDAEFEVPVFRTDKSNPKVSESFSDESAELYTSHVGQAHDSKLMIDYLAEGEVEILIPSLFTRNPGAIYALGIFILIMGGLSIPLLLSGFSMIFPIIFFLINLGLAGLLLSFVFSKKTINASKNGVAVKSSGLLSRPFIVPAEQIEAVSYSVSGSSTNGNETKNYYQVFLKLADKKQKILVYWITSKATAQWVTSNVSEALGLGSEVLVDPESMLYGRLGFEEKLGLDQDQGLF